MLFDAVAALARILEPAIRHITDPRARVWTVQELRTGPVARLGIPTLVFVTDGVIRSQRSYPSNWMTLCDRELYVLSLNLASWPVNHA